MTTQTLKCIIGAIGAFNNEDLVDAQRLTNKFYTGEEQVPLHVQCSTKHRLVHRDLISHKTFDIQVEVYPDGTCRYSMIPFTLGPDGFSYDN
jgi:hypothetical protein